MKKFLFLASAAALLATSCSDDFAPQGKQDLQVEGDTIVTATLNFGEEESGTRTTLGSNYQYYWNQGDQIGVLGAVQGLNVVNAPFIYPNATSATSANFVGSTSLLPYEGYFAYYPWTATNNLNIQGYEGTSATSQLTQFTLSNADVQNFNTAAQESAVWSTQRATGSFGPNAAPAIAYATASANGTINYSFQPIGSYLVFPITSTEALNVNSVTLSIIGNETTYQGQNIRLVQTCEVSIQAGTTNMVPKWTGNLPDGVTDGTSIQLLCSGNGVPLGPTLDPVNFWFVVPAGLDLQGATINLAVSTTSKSEGQKTVTRTRTLDNNWSDSQGNTGTKANLVTWLWQSQGQPFTLNQNSAQYQITSAARFLEYAYLVTNGIEDVYTEWSKLTNYSLTDLQNMLQGADYNGDLTTYANSKQGDLSGLTVKQGVITGTLDLTPSVIKAYFAQNTLTNLAQQAGYYTNVYGNYVYNNAPISSIGDGAVFTLGGVKGSVATITGLRTSGAIFQNMNSNSANIQYLNLQGCNAQAWTEISNSSGGRAFLCAAPANITFTSVTVGANNIGNNLSSSSTSKLISVFYTLDNANLSKWQGVANNAFTYYANTLDVTTYTGLSKDLNSRPSNYAFDFTAINGAAVNNFLNIQYDNTNTSSIEGSLFVVSGKSEAETLMDEFDNSNGVKGQELAYSVIDRVSGQPGTSYWTGRTMTTNTPGFGVNTAEYLAGQIQSGSSFSFAMNVNLNLMGDYVINNQGDLRTWVVPQTSWDKTVTLTLSTYNGVNMVWNNISNIYMESVTEGDMLTLLGGLSYIPNTVNVTDMTVNVQNKECYVAAVSIYPGGSKPSNVTVENFTVKVAQGINSSNIGQADNTKGAVGGIYMSLNLNNIGLVGKNCSYTYGSVPARINAGILCGVFTFDLNIPSALTIPYVGPSNAFGIVNVNVYGNSTRSSFMKVLKANPATPDNWKNWNYYAADDNVGYGYTLYVTDSTAQYLKTATEVLTGSSSSGNTTTNTYGPGWNPSIAWSTISPEVAPYDPYYDWN